MDSYLESLVKKDELDTAPVAKVVEEFVEEPVEELVEEVVEETAPLEETEEKEELKEEVEEEEPKKENKKPAKAEPQSKKHTYEVGQIVNVQNIRVFKTPDVHQISRNVSGNVVFLGDLDYFSVIEYVRHGFGKVKGYTPDL